MKVVIAARLSQLNTGETGLDTQEQQAVTWAEAHGHEVVGIAADHKSGKTDLADRPQLRPWVTDPAKLSQYDALVALKVDRLTRADDEGVSRMKDWARKNGKRLLISSAEVQFPSEGVEGLLWDAYIRMAHQEWLAIQERYARMQAAKHEAGSIVGRGPWGYEIVEVGGIKTIEPTPEGRIWVPKIFAWIAEGKTPKQVGKMLEAEGVKSAAPGGKWHEARIGSMIKRPTYSGMRKRKGLTALEVEPLVSRALQDEAIAKLASRARLGGTGNSQPKALLAQLKCGHPDCPGEGTWPMYRLKNRYYRCTGRGAMRQGCGNPMVEIETLDRMVLGFTAYWDHREYISQRYVSGNDLGARIELLRGQAAEAVRLAPLEQWAGIQADYGAKIAALEAEGSIQPHWEDVHTGETEGQYLQSLDLDGQRDYLARKDIRAWKSGDSTFVTVDGALAVHGGLSAIGRFIQAEMPPE